MEKISYVQGKKSNQTQERNLDESQSRTVSDMYGSPKNTNDVSENPAGEGTAG